jgi:hypothetical protein
MGEGCWVCGDKKNDMRIELGELDTPFASCFAVSLCYDCYRFVRDALEKKREERFPVDPETP